MARRKKADTPAAEKPTNGSAPMTLADVQQAIDCEAKRLSQAETALVLNPGDAEAEQVRRDALAKLKALDAERESLERIAQRRKAAREAETEQAIAAAERKAAARIPERIGAKQRKLAKSIKGALDVLARDVPALEASQHENQVDILALRDGKRGNIEPLMKAARNLSLTLQIRDALRALHGTRLLTPWLTVSVPNAPGRQPMKGESHAESAARADALLARTIDDVFDECVERVQGHLKALLVPPGSPVEPTDPEDVTPWHGRSEAERPDSFNARLARGELAIDTSAQDQRRAQRVADSAKGFERDGEGKVKPASGEDLT